MPERIRILTQEDLAPEIHDVNQRQFGDWWIDSGDSPVLAVRSTIVPLEYNYLLNPRHHDFATIVVEPAVPFVFDERLFGSRQRI